MPRGVGIAAGALAISALLIFALRKGRVPAALEPAMVAAAWVAAGTLLGSLPSAPEVELDLPLEQNLAAFRAELTSAPQATEVGWRAEARASLAHARAPSFFVSLVGDGPPPLVEAGAMVALRGQLFSPSGPTNPGQRQREGALPSLVLARGTWPTVIAGTAPRIAWREATRRTFVAHLALERAAIAQALVLGDSGALPQALRRQFNATGTSHLLAVSGLHLAWVAGAALVVARMLLRRHRRWRATGLSERVAWALALAVAVIYADATGGQVATARATAMFAVVATSTWARRPTDVWTALALAVTALVISEPFAWHLAGFHLSVGAVAALVWVNQARNSDRSELLLFGRPTLSTRILQATGILVLSSVAAHLATAPWTAHHFGSVSWGSAWCNALAIPYTTSVVMPAAALGTLGAALGEPFAGWACAALDLALRGLVALLRWLQPWGFSSPAAGVTAADAACATAAAFACIGLIARPSQWRRFGPALLAALLAWAVVPWLAGQSAVPPPGRLAVVAIDVGHGDAIAVRFPHGDAILVDGGGRGGERGEMIGRRVVTPALRALGISRLAGVVVSHADADHVMGLFEVLRDTPADVLYSAAPRELSVPWVALVTEVLMRGTRIQWLQAGDVLMWERTTARVLAPPGPPTPGASPLDAEWSRNDRSVVLELTHGNRRILLTGDIESRAESWLVAQGTLRKVDVVKVPHHGSRTSSTAPLVRATRPRLAVVSTDPTAGYGLPHDDALARWVEAGAAVLRTDQRGAIEISTDGEDLWFKTYAP